MSRAARHGARMRHPALNRMPRDFLKGATFATPFEINKDTTR
ncbi:hypothetical protein [Mangrovicoccus algicola]|nr:hypothetical protein [Mangrovicoccus algicola]